MEFEGLAQLNNYFQSGWSLGYLYAKLDEYINAFGVNVAGQRVFQNTPDVTASTALSYETPMSLFSAPNSLTVITSLHCRDDISQFETPSPLFDRDACTLWDPSFVREDDDGGWRAGLHGKNLADEEYKVAGYYFPDLGSEGSITAFSRNPMAWTATVDCRFQ